MSVDEKFEGGGGNSREENPEVEVEKGTVKRLKNHTDTVSRDLLFKDAKKNGDTLLQGSCEAKIEDANDKIALVESFRSSREFEILAEKLANKREFPDRKIKVLYPGASAHLAPLAMAAKLIDMGKVDRAELVYTEIAEVDRLKKNLNWLVEHNEDYEMGGRVIEYPRGEKGCEYIFPLHYKGKLIEVRYLYKCSDEEWFRYQDLQGVDVYVSHDGVGPDVEGPLYMVYKIPSQREAMSLFGHFPGPLRSGVDALGKYFPVVRTFGEVAKVVRVDDLPLIVMEDVTRSIDSSSDKSQPYHRQFDLELLGSFDRGGKSGYGHRKAIYKKALKECYESDEYGKTCFANSGELGRADSESGVLLSLYPEQIGRAHV